MRNTKTLWRLFASALLAAATSVSAVSQGFIANPSFENNFTQPWPFYGTIDNWNSTGGGSGVNENAGPFHNSGTPVPDGLRVGFHQGAGTLSQDIAGLTAGKQYWIQFRYDARSGSDLDLAVRFSTINWGGAMDETLATMLKVKPATLTGSPYYSCTVPFTPDFEMGTLTFDITTRGDSTVLLDAVTIVQRDAGNFTVMNPSFEASGAVYDGAPSVGADWPAISGWVKTGVAGVDDGTGGRADNGAIPDQALVAFIADEGSLTQTLRPLVPGNDYQLAFAYNATSGATAHLQVSVDGTVVWEKDVSAVGGGADYARQTVTFKAAASTAQIGFANTAGGATVLLDDVKVLGETGSAMPPMDMTPAKIALRIGEEGTATITVPPERLAEGPAVVKVRSGNTTVFVLPDADASGTVSLAFEGATTTQSFQIRGVAVGNAVVEITDPDGTPFPADITAVFVAGTTFVLNPSFEVDKDSGVGTAAVSCWTTGGANIGMAGTGNPFLSAADLTIPDRRQVLRIQGGGGTVSQMIKGLKVGQLYGLQFFYNARTVENPYELDLQVSFAGQQLANIEGIIPAGQLGLTDYYFKELRFTAAAESGLLEFKTVVASGDATLFLDGVSIIPRLADEIAVKNSSFEASIMGANWPGYFHPERVAGWVPSGGYGVNGYSPTTFWIEPFFDNGINSDQDSVYFNQNAGNIRQTVEGLTPGQEYTLIFDYNFRDGRGTGSSDAPNLGQVEVSVDGGVLFTSEELPPIDTVSPWTGTRHTRPFYQAFVPFTPWMDTAEVQIAHIGTFPDKTLLLDNVHIVPGTYTPPSITKELVDQAVQAGTPVTFSTAATGNTLAYRWYRNGIRLADGNGISGASTATLSLASPGEDDAGTYTVIVTDGLGVAGSVAALAVEPAPTDVTLTISLLAASNIRIAWPATASAFRLQSAATVNGVYADDPAPVMIENDLCVVTVAAQDAAKFYRLTN